MYTETVILTSLMGLVMLYFVLQSILMDQRDIYLEHTGNSYSKTFIMYFLPQKNVRRVL